MEPGHEQEEFEEMLKGERARSRHDRQDKLRKVVRENDLDY